MSSVAKPVKAKANLPSYVPRTCSATNKVLVSSDHTATQIGFAQVNEQGVFNGKVVYVTLSGSLRQSGRADAALNRILAAKKV